MNPTNMLFMNRTFINSIVDIRRLNPDPNPNPNPDVRYASDLRY